MGCDANTWSEWKTCGNFNPRTHRGVRQINGNYIKKEYDISIHAPIVGCDLIFFFISISPSLFQSTHPSWGATKLQSLLVRQLRISIHAPIVGCDDYTKGFVLCDDKFQSTHPSWGATHDSCATYKAELEISIHAPIVGCDMIRQRKLWQKMVFQSTHPSWGATISYHVYI